MKLPHLERLVANAAISTEDPAAPQKADATAEPRSSSLLGLLAAWDSRFANEPTLRLLRRDASSTLYRATAHDGARCLLLLSRNATKAQRLQREYALRDVVETAWAAVPLQLAPHEGQQVLLLADPGGELLQDMLDAPLALSQALRLAHGTASALDALHQAGLAHGDLQPRNILADIAGGVRLTGLGLASPLSGAERTGDVIEGALAYLAPERTGRLDRPADARADLYSFGIVLYQMLTGSLPFHASEPAEWLHCHLARRPQPPIELVAELPEQLSRMVLKLLEKTPEDRYQSAAGIATDLAKCLAYLEHTGIVPRFPIFDEYAGTRLMLNRSLHGRDAEIAAIETALRQARAEAASAFVLIAGRSGVGKSSVVDAFRQTATGGAPLYAAGKFDQYMRDVPYAPLSQCLDALLRHAQALPDPERDGLAMAIRSTLGANAKLLTHLLPGLESLIGPQPALPMLHPAEQQARFQSVIRRFLTLFAAEQRPLVLFLDDLQWLDSATLGFLEDVSSRQDMPHVLWIGAYRNAPADMTPRLAHTLDAIRSSGAIVRQIEVEPLGAPALKALVQEVLHCDEAAAEPLVAVLQDKTQGNPYFTIQCLLTLADHQLLRFDAASQCWQWELDAIRDAEFGENVIDLTQARLRRLPCLTRDMLATLCCLGHAARHDTLAAAHGAAAHDVQAILEPALAASLLSYRDGRYAFAHDHVQEAAYAMLTHAARQDTHLRIARRLLDATPPEALPDAAFDIAPHFVQGAALIRGQADRMAAADVLALAGDKARAASAYASALTFFAASEDLLAPSDSARRLTMAWKRAECEFLTGHLHAADERLRALSLSASGICDQGRVASLRVTLYTAMDRSDRAIAAGLAFLEHAGISWRTPLSRGVVQDEYDKLLAEIGERGIESLDCLPRLSEPRESAVLDVLAAMLPPAFFSDQHLVSLILCRMGRISVRHGNADASPLAYAYLGMVVGSYFGDHGTAYRFGRLGFDLIETKGFSRYRARVSMTFAYHVLPWTRPYSASNTLLRRAFDEAVESGDLTYSGFSACTWISSRLAAGAPLHVIEREANEKLSYVRSTKFGLIVDIISAQRQMVRALRGGTRELTRFDNGSFSEAQFEAHLQANRSLDIAACWYWIRKLQVLVYGGAFEEAVACAGRAEPLLWSTAGHLEYAEYHFFAGLAHAGRHDACAPAEQPAMRDAVVRHLRQMTVWADTAPMNFASRAALLAAELARLDGSPAQAMQHCEQAIQAAVDNGLVHDEALACEYAARLAHAQHLRQISMVMLAEAIRCYARWGAHAKVAAITQEHPQLRDRCAAYRLELPAESPTSTDELDLHAIVRSLQAVSDQASLAKVIDSVMSIALEQAGADRGALILPTGRGLVCRAQARIGTSGVIVTHAQAEVDASRVPRSIVQAAIRRNECVLLDDAREHNPFRDDPYFQTGAYRSVLCVPLRRQSETIGVLYLENSLISQAFTPARISVLQLIASTAAISIENAGLDEKTVLLKEVHHRVKNNLQLISSLLSLQAARIDDPEISRLFTESRDRVRSMALAHENLYRAGNFARVAMGDHLRNLCEQLARAYRMPRQDVRLRVQADDVELDIGRAITCGLIVNELVSNALKHGFVDGRDGTVSVRLHALEQGRCMLEVTDDGIGMPHAREEQGLGLELVKDLVDQLNGTQAVSTGPGVSVSISFDHPPPDA